MLSPPWPDMPPGPEHARIMSGATVNFILPFLIVECAQKRIPSLDESCACNGKHMSPIYRRWFLPFNKLGCVFGVCAHWVGAVCEAAVSPPKHKIPKCGHLKNVISNLTCRVMIC